MPEFGERLKKARNDKDMSQNELAQHMGLTQAAISQFESGQRLPTPANIQRFAQVLGVGEEALAGGDQGSFEKALLMRNIRDLSPKSLSKINEYAGLIKQSEQAKRRGSK